MKLTDIGTQFKEQLIETNALLEGHFVLSSGLHSDRYVQCTKYLQYPDYTSWAAKSLADLITANVASYKGIDIVIGPAYGGIILSHALASFVGVRALFAERVDGILQLRRGQQIEENERVLIVDDVLTTGKSFVETKALVDSYNAQVSGFACLVDRREQVVDICNAPTTSLLSLKVATFSPENCPLCDKQTPLIKPGSRKELNK
jgi:orotate phosphoribosyltransferase